MIISYNGAECVKVSFGDTTLAFNPISKKSKLKAVSFGADIALISLNHPDMNGADQVSRSGKEAFVVDGPGEYEVKDVTIRGVGTTSAYGGSDLINTVYFATLEGINLCFLGGLNTKDVPEEVKERYGAIDVLFVPIGGEGVFGPKEAYDYAVRTEASIIIPIHFGDVGEKDALKKFLKEAGTDVAAVEKLSIKRKDVDGKEGDIVVLSP